jgi:Tol biopolymer transport system component
MKSDERGTVTGGTLPVTWRVKACKELERTGKNRGLSLINLIKHLMIFVLMFGCYGHAQATGDFSLSPDGKRILFSLSKGDSLWDLATYEISTETLKTFKLTGNDHYLEPVYSPNGKKICFVAGKRLQGSNIYILDCDTGNIRQITHTESAYPGNKGPFYSNHLPNFSPDGKRIIFCRSGIVFERANGNLMTTGWDIFEIDISTGAERKLTNQSFFTIKRPYYLPDGKQFIFSASILNNKSGMGPKDFRQYEKLYKGNDIFVMDGNTNELRPAFVHGDRSSQPSVSRDGDVVFVSKTNHLDDVGGAYVFDLFIREKSGVQRLTKMRFSNELNNPFISLDGSHVIFQAEKRERKEPGWTVWLINRDGTGLRELKIADLIKD